MQVRHNLRITGATSQRVFRAFECLARQSCNDGRRGADFVVCARLTLDSTGAAQSRISRECAIVLGAARAATVPVVVYDQEPVFNENRGAPLVAADDGSQRVDDGTPCAAGTSDEASGDRRARATTDLLVQAWSKVPPMCCPAARAMKNAHGIVSLAPPARDVQIRNEVLMR